MLTKVVFKKTKKFCHASGAVVNMEKTKIYLMGNKTLYICLY